MQAIEIQKPDGTLAGFTVKDLRAALEGIPDDTLVVCSKDAEGNEFHPLMMVGLDGYYADSRFGGGEFYEEPRSGAVPCITVWPMD